MSEIFYTSGEAHEVMDVLYVRKDGGTDINVADKGHLIDQNLNTTWEADTTTFNIGIDIIVDLGSPQIVHAAGIWIENGNDHNFSPYSRWSLWGSNDLTQNADPQDAENWDSSGFYSANIDHGYGEDNDRLAYEEILSTSSPITDVYDQDTDGYWYLNYRYFRFRFYYLASETVHLNLGQIYLLKKHTISKNHQRNGSYKGLFYDNNAFKLQGDREFVSRNYINPVTVFKRPFHLIGSSQITVGENIYKRSRGRAYSLIYQPGSYPQDASVVRLQDDMPPIESLDYGYSKMSMSFKSLPYGD